MKQINKIEFNWDEFTLLELKNYVKECEEKFSMNGASFNGGTINDVKFYCISSEHIKYDITYEPKDKSFDY